MSRIPLIVGNWKMNSSRDEAVALARAIAAGVSQGAEIVVCPPFPWLVPVAEAVQDSGISVGAQNCWSEPAGAFTGEVAASMLKDLCRFVIVGHSERRQTFGETDEIVHDKATAVQAAGLTPIVCVGESLDTRQTGSPDRYVRDQVRRAIGNRTGDEIGQWVVAYEPIWAIGTGVAATPDDAEQMSQTIRATIRDVAGDVADGIRILYGGSVTPDNAGELLGGANVGGALVGGASLHADSFLAIARTASR
ncbi:MAG: triose-phosphate isomerase [Thermomicrobiales bacterium]